MTNYHSIISYEDPYPKKVERVVNGSNVATACGRAIREWRAHEGKGNRVKVLTVRITKL
jgi:hypothetical protein